MALDDRAILCGAGAAGVLHALAYRAHGVSVVGVYDPDLARAQTLASLCGARAFATFDDLVRCDAGLASICSPPVAHVDQALRAARGGRVVLVEKPVAVTRSDLDRLVEQELCVPVVQWRAGRALRAVRGAVDAGALGSSPVVGIELAWSRDAAYFAAGRATSASWGCGALLSVGIHAVDAVAWALGRRVVRVSGLLGYRAGVEVETSAVVQLELEGGAIASLRITFDGGGDTTRLTFCGNGVTAEIAGGEADPTASAVQWSAGTRAAVAALEDIERAARGATAPPLLVPYVGDVVRAIRAGVRPGACEALPSIADVANAHAAILAVYGSGETRIDGTASAA